MSITKYLTQIEKGDNVFIITDLNKIAIPVTEGGEHISPKPGDILGISPTSKGTDAVWVNYNDYLVETTKTIEKLTKDTSSAIGNVVSDITKDINDLEATTNNKLATKADLVNGIIPATQLPSYVDDIVEGYYSDGKFYDKDVDGSEIAGEAGKLYINLSPTLEEPARLPTTYRWGGSAFVQISAGMQMEDYYDKVAVAALINSAKTEIDNSYSAKIDAIAAKVLEIGAKIKEIEEAINNYHKDTPTPSDSSSPEEPSDSSSSTTDEPTSNADYIVSGATDYPEINGDYVQDGEYNGKPKYVNTTSNATYTPYMQCDSMVGWAIFYPNQPRAYTNDTTSDTPPTTGWNNGVTVTKGGGSNSGSTSKQTLVVSGFRMTEAMDYYSVSSLNGEYVIDDTSKTGYDRTWTNPDNGVTLLYRSSWGYWGFSNSYNSIGGDIYTYGENPYNADGSSTQWQERGADSVGQVIVKS